MELNIVTIEDLNQVKKELIEIITEKINHQNSKKLDYIKAKEVRSLLKISNNTLSSLIAAQKIKRIKIGKSYYYSMSQIQQLFIQSYEK